MVRTCASVDYTEDGSVITGVSCHFCCCCCCCWFTCPASLSVLPFVSTESSPSDSDLRLLTSTYKAGQHGQRQQSNESGGGGGGRRGWWGSEGGDGLRE